MPSEPSLWRAVRWPLALLVIAGVAIATATVLDQFKNELSLTIGAPALTVLLPVGLVWLVVAVIVYAARRRRSRS
jgi:hypothetical protein